MVFLCALYGDEKSLSIKWLCLIAIETIASQLWSGRLAGTCRHICVRIYIWVLVQTLEGVECKCVFSVIISAAALIWVVSSC